METELRKQVYAAKGRLCLSDLLLEIANEIKNKYPITPTADRLIPIIEIRSRLNKMTRANNDNSRN